MTEEATFEMCWDCKYCGQKKLLGLTHRFCAKCGAPQDPSTRYFPPDDEKVAVKDNPFVGADVVCPACKHPMSLAASCCTNCGSPIDKGAHVALRADVVVPDHNQSVPSFGDAAPVAPPRTSKTVPMVLAALAALVVVTLLVAVFWKRESALEVAGHVWERSIAIERFDLARKSAWCDDRPSGARELSRRREQRGSTQVKDGETCQTRKKDNGNGTYKEVRECQPKYKSEPIMSDRCDFEVTEWRPARTLSGKGDSPNDPPRWPAVSLSRPGACVGCEREGSRSEKYTVKFVDTKRNSAAASCDLPEARWGSFAKGTRWKGSVRALTGGVDCSTLVRQ